MIPDTFNDVSDFRYYRTQTEIKAAELTRRILSKILGRLGEIFPTGKFTVYVDPMSDAVITVNNEPLFINNDSTIEYRDPLTGTVHESHDHELKSLVRDLEYMSYHTNEEINRA